ncbi:hypothetical protein EVA_08997 [gut metagenome]|uniref:Uncharacterized protein n=1 Tax=gut metagenome TaxID=749906 RepID=J9G7Q1_9ZZZZ
MDPGFFLCKMTDKQSCSNGSAMALSNIFKVRLGTFQHFFMLVIERQLPVMLP